MQQNRGRIPLSIIIPTLNEEKWLPLLLKSLLEQQASVFEVIVVDARSEDGTDKVAKGFEDLFEQKGIGFKLINSPRRNVAYQRNLGAEEAVGAYLCFLDADVVVVRSFVRRVLKKFEEGEIDLLGGWAMDQLENWSDRVVVRLVNWLIWLSVLFRHPLIPGCCFVVKADVFAAARGFDPQLRVGEDYVLAKKILDQGHRVRLVRECWYRVSLRRYYRWGRVNTLLHYVFWGLSALLKGREALSKETINYPMGGGIYHRTL